MTNMRFLPALLKLGFLMLIVFAGDAKAFQAEDISSDFRTWSNSTGKFTIEAKLVEVIDSKATLQKKDGRLIKLPLKKLSKKDIAFVEELRKNAADPDNPFAAGEANPFAGGEAPSGRSKKRDGGVVTVDVSQVLPDTTLTDEKWRVVIDAPIDDGGQRKLTTRPITVAPVSEKRAFHDKRARPVVDRAAKLVAVSASNAFSDSSALAVIDLATGENVAAEALPIEDLKVFAIDTDNKQLLTFVKERGRKPGRIEFRDFGDLRSPVKIWQTADFFQDDGFRPKHGFIVGPNRLLTLGDNIVLWDIESAQTKYVIEIGRASIDIEKVAFSPTQKTLAFVTKKSVSLVDVASGELHGVISAEESPQAIAFSPTGDFLAGIDSGGQVWVWDLHENQMVQQFKSDGRRSLVWVDERHLLVDNKDLLNIEYRVCVWQYEPEHRSEIVGLGNGDFLLQTKKNLLTLKLPHSDLSSKIEELDPEDLLLIRPGDEFAIDFDLPFDSAEQKKIRESLEERMQEMGHSVNAQAEMTLRGRVTTGKRQTTKVKSWDNRGPTTNITYKASRSTIEILKDDKVIWETSYYHGPAHMIHTRGDETLQEYADRVSKVTPSLFYSFKIPTNLATLPGGKPLGKSRLMTARRK